MLSGGESYGYQVVEYDIATNTFVDHGNNVLGTDTYGYGVFYTQYDAKRVFTIRPDGRYIYVLNLETLQYSYSGAYTPTDVNDEGCIASSNVTEALYITGGYSSSGISTVQVYSLSSSSWLSSIPSMNYARGEHGCIVEPTNLRLYAIGGYGDATIESIDITNIQNVNWKTFDSTLSNSYSARYPGVASVEGLIYIFGGGYTTVHVIDTATSSLSVHSETLPYGAYGTATVAVGNVIYGFGGVNRDEWFYYEATTPSPTAAPTDSPSRSPSAAPTASPTPYCTTFNVDIVDFGGFTANDLASDTALQSTVANATHFAITESASGDAIDDGAFYVIYDDATGSSEYVDGRLERSVFIDHSLCALALSELDALRLMIENEGGDIAATLMERLRVLFLDGNDTEMEVAVHLLSKLGPSTLEPVRESAIISRSIWTARTDAFA